MSRMRGSTFFPNSSSAYMSGSRSPDPGGCRDRSSTPAPTTSRQRRTCSTIVSGLPMNVVGSALLAVVARGLADGLERAVGDAAAEVVARGELAGFATRAEGVGRRMRLLQRTRPDGHGAVLEVAALPAERLRLRPRSENELHALVGSLPRLRRVEVVGQVLVRRSPQQPDDQAPLGQGVAHRQLLGNAHR